MNEVIDVLGFVLVLINMGCAYVAWKNGNRDSMYSNFLFSAVLLMTLVPVTRSMWGLIVYVLFFIAVVSYYQIDRKNSVIETLMVLLGVAQLITYSFLS